MENLNSHEKKKLKRKMRQEQEEKESGRAKRKKMIKNVGILSTLIIAIGAIGLSMFQGVEEGPKIQITPERYDFGSVRVSGGEVTKLMTVKNIGKDDLKITRMESSCGCTSASMVVDGIEGPRFSMASHGTNPTGWSVTLEPGETTQLKVYYDPTVHRDMRGPVTRTVTIFSNDPISYGKNVVISANQVS
jgi:hypothetical protein